MKRTGRLTWSVMLVLVTSSCGDIGAPMLVSRDAPPEQRLVGCRNVVPNYPHQPFSPDFYFTTWRSAVQEGAAIGEREGLVEAGGVGDLVLMQMAPPDVIGGEPVIWRDAVQPAYCMRVPVSSSRLQRSVRRALAELRIHGYSFNGTGGEFVTSFASCQHSAARWVDRFRASVASISSEEASVYVVRDVAISRQGSPFAEATSIGHLEAGILTRARDLATSGR